MILRACATSRLIILSPNSTKRISFKSYSRLSPLSQSFHISSRLVPPITFFCSHERIRRMQHKLFHSKFRPSVEDSSLLEIIRSSSSGENPHRAASMELVFEKSIREHRERINAGARESKTQPSSVTPLVTDKKPVTAKPVPVKSEEKKPPPPKPTSEPYKGGCWFRDLQLDFVDKIPLQAQATTSPLKPKRQ